MSRLPIIWGKEVNALRLGIALEQSSQAKNAISLQLYLTNVSQTDVRIVESYLLREHEIAILTAANQPVSMTVQGKQALKAAKSPFYRRISKLLEPRVLYKVQGQVSLNQWFELERSGRYILCVRRKGWQNEQGELLSSLAHFSICPQKQEQDHETRHHRTLRARDHKIIKKHHLLR